MKCMETNGEDHGQEVLVYQVLENISKFKMWQDDRFLLKETKMLSFNQRDASTNIILRPFICHISER